MSESDEALRAIEAALARKRHPTGSSSAGVVTANAISDGCAPIGRCWSQGRLLAWLANT